LKKASFWNWIETIGENTAQASLQGILGTIEKLAVATSEDMLEINGSLAKLCVTQIHDFLCKKPIKSL